ncbi:unnamed protein product [Heligmosomoides polygyrus]|uniref:Major sperm protein n=1 Tax=Heligmosomoides polygyrus TaxID=6339 RepID=A0A183G5T9_HELPZ|nr:unnamed protein product [Heligmosomoides polygyrus]
METRSPVPLAETRSPVPLARYPVQLASMPSSSVTPSDANVPAAGGQTMHQIHNNSDQRMMFKVKLSNADDYRVSPVFGFVDASSNANIEVIRKSGAPRNDRMVVQLVPAPQDATDARAVFGQVQNVPNEDMFTLKSTSDCYAGLGTEVYMTPQPNSTKTGAQQFDEMFYMFGNCNLIVSSIWIQVTSPANWSPTSKTNIAFLNSIFARAGQYGGITIGIYTNANEWSKITGSAKITNARLWYWNVQGGGVPNETPANFNDFRSFGGWSAPSVKQFAQSEAFCGVTVNRLDIFKDFFT